MRVSPRWLWVVLVLASGCRSMEDFVVQSVSVSGVQADAGVWVMDIDLVLDNPNRFPVQIDPAQLAIRLEGDSIGHLVFGPDLRLEGKGATPLGLKARLHPERTQNAALRNPMGLLSGALRLQVEGAVSGSSWGVTRTVDIRVDQPLDLDLFR